MKYLFFIVLISIIFSCSESLTHPTISYNEKANELIQQIILEESKNCSCVLVPNQSLIENLQTERPLYFAHHEESIMKQLNVKDRTGLDSLADLSHQFKLNNEFVRKNGIKMVESEIFKTGPIAVQNECPKGIAIISKPIFDKDFKNAFVTISIAYMCIPPPIRQYENINNQWILN